MAKTKKSQPQSLPDTVYVVREYDGADSYLTAWETLNDVEDESIVGVYELVRTSKKVVTHTLA